MSAVAKQSKAVAAMVEAASRGRALLGGSTAMRAAGETYLPKFAKEDPKDYEARLNQSWLFNGYRKTIRDMTGKVFDKPVEIGDGAGENLILMAENVDLQGRDVSAFSRGVFQAGYTDGVTYIMVDAPPRPAEGVSRDVAARQNLRPYMVHIDVASVLGWKTIVVNNVTTLSQFRILETVSEQDPKDEFAEVEVQQVRVLDRQESGGVITRLYREGKKDWELFGEPTVSDMTEITIVPFYANRTGFFTGEPLLDDLADINIAHWQSQSDQRNILHVARVPILVASGFNDEDSIEVGSSSAIKTSNPDAKVAWVEHSGAAIGAGVDDLKALEFQMETFGLQLLVANVNQSATGEALDAAKETSTLAATADAFKDAMERAFNWMAAYAGNPDASITVTVNKKYGAGTMTAQELTVLLTAVNTGNLSQETFLRKLIEAGMIASDTDVDEEMERTEGDTEALMNGS